MTSAREVSQAQQDAPVDVANLSQHKARVMVEMMLALGGEGLKQRLSTLTLEGYLCSLFDHLYDLGKAVDAMHAEHVQTLQQQAAQDAGGMDDQQGQQDAPVDVATLSLEKARALVETMLALGGQGLQQRLPALTLESLLSSLFGHLHDLDKAVDAMHAEHVRALRQPVAIQGGAA